MTNASPDQNRRQEIITKIILFGVVVALPLIIGATNLIAFLMINKQHPDDRVADDFYKKALAVHKNAEPNRLALERGIAARLTVFTAEQTVELELLGEHASPQHLQLEWIHPIDSSQDRRVILARVSAANYRGYFAENVSRYASLRLSPVIETAAQDRQWLLTSSTETATAVAVPDGEVWKLSL